MGLFQTFLLKSLVKITWPELGVFLDQVLVWVAYITHHHKSVAVTLMPQGMLEFLLHLAQQKKAKRKKRRY